jgi:hypothetical protein
MTQPTLRAPLVKAALDPRYGAFAGPLRLASGPEHHVTVDNCLMAVLTPLWQRTMRFHPGGECVQCSA